MGLPKITIITPSFNQGSFLEETICSVLDQGYPNLEYIIIDGGSTDNSTEIIKKYEKQLAYWTSEKDNGMYDAIQKGFARSTGEIMGWINSDDRYHPKSLFVLAEVFGNHSEVNWLQGNPTSMDEQGRIVASFSSRRWSRFHFYLKDYKYIQQESTFWRRSLWEASGASLRTDLKLAGDFELWLRFFDHARLYCLRAPLGTFRLRSGNQFSLDRISEYNAECESEIAKRLTRLSADELSQLNYLKRYWSVYARIPFVKKGAKSKFNDILDFPPSIVFDRKKQQFFLKPDAV